VIELTELQQKIIDMLKQIDYLAIWQIEELTNVSISGCGVPTGDNAVEELVRLGLIEELPELACRYRIVASVGDSL
jgi:hypothetical protein